MKCFKISLQGLERFINHQILQFDNAKDIPIHFIGSISYYLKEEIEKALALKDSLWVESSNVL